MTDSENEKMFCGMGPVPKGMVRGTPEYCLQNNQVRYYGIVAIDPKLLEGRGRKTSDIVKEQLKLKKLENQAKLLVKDVKNLKVLLDNDELSKSRKKLYEKKMDDLFKKRDKLIKQLQDQKKIVQNMERDEELKEKAAKNKSTKSKSVKGKSTAKNKTVGNKSPAKSKSVRSKSPAKSKSVKGKSTGSKSSKKRK